MRQLLLLTIVPVLLSVGSYLKNRDSNPTGTDDAAGNICNALAPALSSLAVGNDNSFRKALKVVRDTIDGYLNSQGLENQS